MQEKGRYAEGGAVRTRHIRVGSTDTFVQESGTGPANLFVHGNPDTSDQWLPFLRQADHLGHVIAPDLPGFGRSSRPESYEFDYTVDAYAQWFEYLLDGLGVDRFRLVVHDWGAVALPAAIRHAERLDGLVIVDAVPLAKDYRWHWIARLWRKPLIGEALMLAFNRGVLKQLTRLSSPRRGPQSDEFLDDVTRYLDHRTKQAILRLYRSADPEVLERAGRGLEKLTCPALVVWGAGDPYIGVDQAHRYVERLPNGQLELFAGVGHWCWREDGKVVKAIADFLIEGC
jgi:pimeloyl-ACP methyl ester carboxylesterase